ncbi:MAG TPA: acyl-CoA dehydrogenase family protein [Geminicoccaceae bacterium]|nr:acyl-CoA dehydrogenase family protein [Geminicoccaceae bacterium]
MSSALRVELPGRTDWLEVVRELGPGFAAAAARHDADDSFVAENFRALKARRVLSAGVPGELGGGDATYRELADMLRTLAGYCGSTALTLAMHCHPLALLAWRWRHEQAPVEPLLRRIAAEELQLVSSGGSDWLPGSGTARKVEGGFEISGTKRFASGSPVGDLLMTCAIHDDPESGPTVLHFGVPLKGPNVRLVDNWRAMGMRGTGSGDVVVEGLFLGEGAIGVRRPAGKWHRLFHIIAMVAIPLIYAVYVGVAEKAREIGLEQARRRGDGDPDLPYLVGEMENELTLARLALDDMVALAESAEPGPATTSRVLARRTLAGRSAIRTVEAAFTLCGGAAFRRDHPLERLFRDVQGARFHPLQEKAQLWLTGREAMGLPIDR